MPLVALSPDKYTLLWPGAEGYQLVVCLEAIVGAGMMTKNRFYGTDKRYYNGKFNHI